jgi:hypothetical protein
MGMGKLSRQLAVCGWQEVGMKVVSRQFQLAEFGGRKSV